MTLNAKCNIIVVQDNAYYQELLGANTAEF
jgi:hypothetical protein